ncbi:glycosyltransferase [Siminovitchia acidinfaciens]|uniref:N-acetylglucosaminyldiphosphoundecaprenol N-acetyl-beta-D-mannosaminyltransferase n=1 Tax=Siminovitchia acidinfaciens TaxID=2321395 RepID=A0A429XZL3_9BACI|nr:WecB/TagA/CpsF family glycosyltransferase [Siminovitchia acidinfaciens]RST74222.1 glycosyltransferase [Siminovitchia acidinfaciens]
MSKKVDVLGIEFEHTTKTEIIYTLEKRIRDNKKTFIVTANPEIVMYAQRDSQYKNIVQSADYILPDGIGIIMGAKLLKNPLPERIPGFDLMKDLLTIANKEQLRVFFLGARENVLNKAIDNVKHDYPGIQIAGCHHGFFNEEDPEVATMVQESNPDIVFVALGFPRQERWIRNNAHLFQQGIFMGVGGSFDVLSGTVKRAPALWRKLNIEWLYRLIKQPQRWKRMTFLPIFMLKVIFTRKQDSRSS